MFLVLELYDVNVVANWANDGCENTNAFVCIAEAKQTNLYILHL